MKFLEIVAAGPYNVLFAVALTTGLLLAFRAGRADGRPRLAWAVLLAAGVTFGLIGSKVLIFDFQRAAYGEKSNLGGIAAGVVAVLIVARVLGLGARRTLDTLSVPTLTAMAIGRVGCFLAGCCRGIETSLPWGVRYGADSHAVHPVQLYESFADVALIGLLMRVVPRRDPGYRFRVAVVGYATIRFGSEFLRAGRDVVGGLNPVQWSVLAIGAAVLAWHLRQNGGDVRPRQTRRALAVGGGERAFGAAFVVAALLTSLTLAFAAWFTPLERVTLMVASAGLLTYAITLRRPRALVVRLAPSLGALLLVQQPQHGDGPRTEVVAGGSIWRGTYDRIVGRAPDTYYSDDCGGGTIPGERFHAGRAFRATRVSAGVRQRINSGDHITVEGQMVIGRDNVTAQPSSMQYVQRPLESFGFAAGGARATVEGRDAAYQLEVLGGSMSAHGERTTGLGVAALIRGGSERGFFLEGKLADTKWFTALGETSYAGIGYRLTESGSRLVLGAGYGTYAGLHVPIRQFEIDVARHGGTNSNDVLESRGWWTVGVKKRFTIR
jgi:phosphatidylglycerol:prolipoprotein diacylglycerol transferase